MKMTLAIIAATGLFGFAGLATWYYLERYQPAQERAATLAAISAAYGEAQAQHADRFLNYYAAVRNEPYTSIWRQTAEADPEHPFKLLETIEAYAADEARTPTYTWLQVIESAREAYDQTNRAAAFRRASAQRSQDESNLAWLPIAEWTGKKTSQARYTVEVDHPNAIAGRLRVSFTPTGPYGQYGFAIAVYNETGTSLGSWKAETTTAQEILLDEAQAYTVEVTSNGAWTATIDQGIPARIYAEEQEAANIQAQIEAQEAADNPRYQYNDLDRLHRAPLPGAARRPIAAGYTYDPDANDLSIPTTIDEHGRRVQVTAPR